MKLLTWLCDMLMGDSHRPMSFLDVRVEALAVQWRVGPATAWRLVQTDAVQSLTSMEAVVEALQGLSYDEAREQVGEG